jgi:hypothetical protein
MVLVEWNLFLETRSTVFWKQTVWFLSCNHLVS